MIGVLNIIGLSIAGLSLAAILWSMARPRNRLWPPNQYTRWTPVLVWVPTFALFGVTIALGVSEWGEMGFPYWLRYGVGGGMIVAGNIVVWSAVAGFGMDKTGGAVGELETGGFYRYSRNPQYLADITMLFGWLLLSASSAAIPVTIAAIAALIAAPFAEEPWLEQQYGEAYRKYRHQIHRFF